MTCIKICNVSRQLIYLFLKTNANNIRQLHGFYRLYIPQIPEINSHCMKVAELILKLKFAKRKNLRVTLNGLTFLILSFIDDLVQLPITQSVLLFGPSQMCSDLYAPFSPVFLSSQSPSRSQA